MNFKTYSFYSLVKTINVFVSGYYPTNPREQNGFSNLKGRNLSTAQIANNTTVMSVPDENTVRGGINLEHQKIFYGCTSLVY